MIRGIEERRIGFNEFDADGNLKMSVSVDKRLHGVDGEVFEKRYVRKKMRKGRFVVESGTDASGKVG